MWKVHPRCKPVAFIIQIGSKGEENSTMYSIATRKQNPTVMAMGHLLDICTYHLDNVDDISSIVSYIQEQAENDDKRLDLLYNYLRCLITSFGVFVTEREAKRPHFICLAIP